MAFSTAGFSAGIFERGSKLIQDEIKGAEELVDSSIKMWSEMGLPVWRARKKQRKELEQVADFLKGKGFSNDQIYTAMRQGQHKSVADYVKKYETDTKKQFGGTMAADIISFAPDYKDSGMTMDQVLDGVMGKVSSGMSISDAIADTTGKDISGIQAAIMKKRAAAVSSAFGVDPMQYRSLAMDDLEYGEKLGGTITLPGTGATKLTGQAGRYGRFFRLFGNELGFKADYDAVNDKPIYPEEAKQKAGEAMLLATEGNVIVAKLMQEDPTLTVEEAEQKAGKQILERLRSPDTGTGEGEGEDTGEEKVGNARVGTELSNEETTKVYELSEQISGKLDNAMGVPKNETERLALLQELIDLYVSFGFPENRAKTMAEFRFGLILDQKSAEIRERNRLEKERNRMENLRSIPNDALSGPAA